MVAVLVREESRRVLSTAVVSIILLQTLLVTTAV